MPSAKSVQNPDLHGIVLAGGKSTRMQTDKALLKYDDCEQWKAVKKLLIPFVEKTHISINNIQNETWAKSENDSFIIDEISFENKGPISGILSVAEKNPQKGFFVLGIDYPFLKMENLITLFNQRTENQDAVCYEKEGFMEPLCTIYEYSSIEKMKIYFENGGESLSRFLKTINVKVINFEDANFLQNVNSRKEYLSLKSNSSSND